MIEKQADDEVDDDWGEADVLAMQQVPQDLTSAGQTPTPTGSDGGSGDLPKPINGPAESRHNVPMTGPSSGITPDDRLLAKLRADASNACPSLAQRPADSNHQSDLARKHCNHNRSEGSIPLGQIGDRVAETPDDRLAAKLCRESNNDSSNSFSNIITAGGSSSSFNDTPDDRLAAKLCGSNNSLRLDETPDDRLTAKVLGASSGTTGSTMDSANRSLRLGDITMPGRGAANDSNRLHTSGAGSHNMSKSQKLTESAELGVGAFAVRGAEAAEYEEGRRSSRFTDDDDDDDDDNDDESLSDGVLDAVVTVPDEQEKNKSKWPNRQARIALGICAVVVLIAVSAGATLATRPSTSQDCQLFVELPMKNENVVGSGSSVAISGDTIIVGAPNSPSGKGSVHVYDRSGEGTWKKLPAVLTPSSSFSGDSFGKALGIYNDTIVVGAMMKHTILPGQPVKLIGCAYVFSRQKDSSWVERARLHAKIPSRSDPSFASALAIHGDTILVAEPNKIISIETELEPVADKGIDSDSVGTVYFFEKRNNKWEMSLEHRRFSAGFGISVGIHAEIAAVGAEEKAYLFRKKENKTWHLDSFLITAEASISFGTSVAVSPREIVVGDSGKAFIFANAGGKSKEVTKISPSNRTASAGFGKSVGVYKTQIIVGSDEKVGKVYLFRQDSVGNWTETHMGVPSDYAVGNNTGSIVAINADTAVVSTSHHVYTFDTSARC